MSAPKEPAYDEHISPLMSKVIALCKAHGINMAAQFSLGYDEENASTLFCTTVLHDLDREDAVGVKRMTRLHREMYPPHPDLMAFTIVNSKARS